MGSPKFGLLDREGLIYEDTPFFEGLFDAGYQGPVQIAKDQGAAIAIFRQRIDPCLFQINLPQGEGDPLLRR